MWLLWYLGPPRNALSEYWQMLLGFSLLPLMVLVLTLTSSDYKMWPMGVGLWLMFIGLTAFKYEEEAQAFVRYLRGEWKLETAAPPAKPADGTDGSAPARLEQTRLLLLILDQAQQDLEHAQYQSAMLPAMLWIAAYALLMIAHSSTFSPSFWLLPALLVMSILVLLPGLARSEWRVVASYRQRLRSRLDQSMLAARLAAGECGFAQLARYTPPWLQYLSTPAQPAQGLRRRVARTALAHRLEP